MLLTWHLPLTWLCLGCTACAASFLCWLAEGAHPADGFLAERAAPLRVDPAAVPAVYLMKDGAHAAAAHGTDQGQIASLTMVRSSLEQVSKADGQEFSTRRR